MFSTCHASMNKVSVLVAYAGIEEACEFMLDLPTVKGTEVLVRLTCHMLYAGRFLSSPDSTRPPRNGILEMATKNVLCG